MAAETKIKIAQIPPYDGEYLLDLDEGFSTREWQWVWRIAECGPLTIDASIERGAPDVIVALAVIAMRRAEKISRESVLDVADKLLDTPFDDSHITLIGGDEDDADPLDVTASEPESESSSSSSSGPASRNGSDTSPATGPNPIGTTRLDTSSISGQEISAT